MKNLKKSLLNVLINSELEETTSSNKDQDTDNGEIYQIDNTSSKSEQESDFKEHCLGLRLYNCQDCKSINMLTKNQINTLISIKWKIHHLKLNFYIN